MHGSMVDGLVLLLNQIWMVPIGVLGGILVGAMPGLSASNSLAILLPVLLLMPPVQGLVLAVSIYAGAEMGGSFPGILLRIPGTASAAVTAIEGYPMMQRGEGARALGISILASVFGALFGGAASILAAPMLSVVALKFSPVEVAIVIIFGIAVIALVSAGGLLKGMMAGFLGLLLGVVGTDPIYGQFRGTMGLIDLYDGLTIIAVLIGLLGFSEVLIYVETGRGERPSAEGTSRILNVRNMLTGFMDVVKNPFETIRSSAIGLVIGAVPGAGASVAAFVAYQQSMTFASESRRKLFGHGSVDGMIACESSNNAVVGGSLVPLLTLGLPGSASMAVLLVVMGYHGLAVGPTLFNVNGDIAYAVLWSQFAAAFFILIMGVGLAFVAFYAVQISITTIVPIVSVLCLIGGFSNSASIFDMGMVVFFGVVGYFMKKHDYPVIALLLGIILGRLFEENFFKGMLIGFNSVDIFFTRPLAQLLWALLVVSLAVPPIARLFVRKRKGGAWQGDRAKS